jgi:hypothetical protein
VPACVSDVAAARGFEQRVAGMVPQPVGAKAVADDDYALGGGLGAGLGLLLRVVHLQYETVVT